MKTERVCARMWGGVGEGRKSCKLQTEIKKLLMVVGSL